MDGELAYQTSELRAWAAFLLDHLRGHRDAPPGLWASAERLQALLDGVEPELLGGAEELALLVRDGVQYVEAGSP
jgi:hypothetical protein